MIELEISTHSGDIDVIKVDEYEPQEMATKLNDNDVHSILIGDNIYSRIDIKNIKPVHENAE